MNSINDIVWDNLEKEYQNFAELQAQREVEIFGVDGVFRPSFRLLKRSEEKEVLKSWNRAKAQITSMHVNHERLWYCQKAAKTANKHGWTYKEFMLLLFVQSDK